VSTLEQIRDGWNHAADQNAMGNILTQRKTWDEDAFFQTGRDEIAQVLAHLDELGLRGDRRKEALDFGCGVGRLTVALADHYENVAGIDIAPNMIAKARGKLGVRYFSESSLAFVPVNEIDLIYSNITLQHMPQSAQLDYIEQFLRVLHPDGLAVFNTPEGPEYQHPEDHLSMYSLYREVVEQVVTDAGGVVLDVDVIPREISAWIPYRYTIQRAK
jgi:trans-aconitate methyltransferase